MKHILLITVNYYSANQTVEFCRHLRASAGSDLLSIVIADNSACFAETAVDDALRDEFAQANIQVIDCGSNLGYFGGAAHVLREWLSRNSMPDCVIVANSDIEIRSEGFFQNLAHHEAADDVFALAPDIARVAAGAPIDALSFRENPMSSRRPSRLSMRLRLAVKQTRPLALAQQWLANRRRHLRRQASTPPGGTSIYMMHGSFMVLLRRYFEATAGLHFPGFLFGEELFVAEETRKAQGRIVFAPTLQLNHWGGATTNELGSARRDRLEADSLRLMIRAYF